LTFLCLQTFQTTKIPHSAKRPCFCHQKLTLGGCIEDQNHPSSVKTQNYANLTTESNKSAVKQRLYTKIFGGIKKIICKFYGLTAVKEDEMRFLISFFLHILEDYEMCILIDTFRRILRL
jgi:hypothetical protein